MTRFNRVAILPVLAVALALGVIIGTLDLDFTQTLAAGLGGTAIVVLGLAGYEVKRQLRKRRERHKVPGQLEIPVG